MCSVPWNGTGTLIFSTSPDSHKSSEPLRRRKSVVSLDVARVKTKYPNVVKNFHNRRIDDLVLTVTTFLVVLVIYEISSTVSIK